MPLDKDPRGGGTRADGSRSNEFCSFCFEDGEFIWEEATMSEMQVLCEEKLMEMGQPVAVAKALVAEIPGLKRWKE